MPIPLIYGSHAALAPHDPAADILLVRLTWSFPDGSPVATVDTSVFLLNADGVAYRDRAMVYYGQPTHLNDAIVQPQNEELLNRDTFQIALRSIPNTVHKLMFCLTLEATGNIPAFNAVAAIQMQVIDVATGNILVDDHSHSELGTEHGLMVAELYRDGHGWVFRSIDQGFAGRLAALAVHFDAKMGDEELPQSQTIIDPGPVQPVSGQNHDCACRVNALSKAGMTGCELLVSLWQEKMALNPNSLIINLINEDPIHKVRMLLRREHGCPLITPEIQHVMRRELWR